MSMDLFLANNQSDSGGTVLALLLGMALVGAAIYVAALVLALGVVLVVLYAVVRMCGIVYELFAARSGKHVGL